MYGPILSALPNAARCSDDLAAEHYQMVHDVLMVSLWPTIELNHIFYWNYNRLKNALGGCTLWVVARCFDDLAAAHYQLAQFFFMTQPQRITDWRTLF